MGGSGASGGQPGAAGANGGNTAGNTAGNVAGNAAGNGGENNAGAAGTTPAQGGSSAAGGSGGTVGTGGTKPEPPPAGQPVFLAVGYGGHRTRSLDGVRWRDHVIDDPKGGDDKNLLRGAGWGDGVFVVVGDRILTSPDGATWTKRALTPASFLNGAAFGNGVWVAAGGNGLRLRSNDNAVTWEVRVPYMAGHFRGLAFGNGRFVAVGHRDNAGMASVSSNGTDWSAPTIAGSRLGRLAFGNGVFVAVGDGGRVAVSADGDKWMEQKLGTADRLMITFGNGLFVTTESDGFSTSPDGRVWTRVKSTGAFSTFAGANGQWVGVLYQARMHHGTDLAKLAFGEAMAPDFAQIIVGYIR